jgi:hypothetical protein
VSASLTERAAATHRKHGLYMHRRLGDYPPPPPNPGSPKAKDSTRLRAARSCRLSLCRVSKKYISSLRRSSIWIADASSVLDGVDKQRQRAKDKGQARENRFPRGNRAMPSPPFAAGRGASYRQPLVLSRGLSPPPLLVRPWCLVVQLVACCAVNQSAPPPWSI